MRLLLVGQGEARKRWGEGSRWKLLVRDISAGMVLRPRVRQGRTFCAWGRMRWREEDQVLDQLRFARPADQAREGIKVPSEPQFLQTTPECFELRYRQSGGIHSMELLLISRPTSRNRLPLPAIPSRCLGFYLGAVSFSSLNCTPVLVVLHASAVSFFSSGPFFFFFGQETQAIACGHLGAAAGKGLHRPPSSKPPVLFPAASTGVVALRRLRKTPGGRRRRSL